MAKIVYIGSFSRIYDEEGIARSLEKLGHEVVRISEPGFYSATTQFIVKEKPDFVLYAKLKIPMVWRPPFFRAMRDNEIKTVCWIPDLFIGLTREKYIHIEESIFQADFVFTPDGGHDEKWKEFGVNHHLLRQGIYDEDCVTGEGGEVSHEIAFIGTANGEFPYRQTLMHELASRYRERFLWVGRYNANELRGQDLSDFIASTKIIIGDSVYSKGYWSNRIYETIGRGGFIIHPNIPGLEKEFTYYKHFVPYDYGDFDGLFEKIDYYLTHDTERKYIAQTGQEYVRENHTLINRCQQLLKIVL